MSESTFEGDRVALLQALAGNESSRMFDEEVCLSVLEFLDAHGAIIRKADDQSDSLEIRLAGPVFVSVRKFVWGSAAAILGLVVAIATSDPKVVASAAQVAGSLLSSLSIFPPDTTEFKAYSAIAALQKRNPSDSPSLEEVKLWLRDQGEITTKKELSRGVEELLRRELLRRAGEDKVRIVW